MSNLPEDKIVEAMDKYFSQDRKFINTDRIPLICQDIRNIHTDLKEIKGNMTWVTRLIVGAVIMALLAMIFKK